VPERETTPTEPLEKIVPGMMPILHSFGVSTPGQFGPIRRDFDPHSARFTLTMSITGMPSVMQTISGTSASIASRMASAANGGGHVDLGRGGARALDGSATVSNTGTSSSTVVPPFPGDAAHDLRAVGQRLLGVEGALGAGDPLGDHLGGLVDEDAHQADFRTACTIFSAPSARSSAAMTFRPGLAQDLLAEIDVGALEPDHQRDLEPTSLTAAITPSAMMSQRMMPPKMLTRMPRTRGSP
jgi:hypothetical protein